MLETPRKKINVIRHQAKAVQFRGRGVLVVVGTFALTGLVLAGLWQIVVTLPGVNAYIAKTPAETWTYLFGSEASGAHRSALYGPALVTLGHAAIGFVVGTAGSVAVAVVFAMVRPLEVMFMPIAMLLRTVPLLAMAPVIYVVFGSGLLTAGLVGGIVVFFPILVNIALGMRSVASQSVDLVRVHGGTRWTVMRKIAIPTALPYFLASVRIAVPGSVTGALLYEWLFTFEGLGARIPAAKAAAQYAEIWAIVAAITVACVLLYAVATMIEALVLARWGPDAGGAQR